MAANRPPTLTPRLASNHESPIQNLWFATTDSFSGSKRLKPLQTMNSLDSYLSMLIAPVPISVCFCVWRVILPDASFTKLSWKNYKIKGGIDFFFFLFINIFKLINWYGSIS